MGGYSRLYQRKEIYTEKGLDGKHRVLEKTDWQYGNTGGRSVVTKAVYDEEHFAEFDAGIRKLSKKR